MKNEIIIKPTFRFKLIVLFLFLPLSLLFVFSPLIFFNSNILSSTSIPQLILISIGCIFCAVFFTVSLCTSIHVIFSKSFLKVNDIGIHMRYLNEAIYLPWSNIKNIEIKKFKETYINFISPGNTFFSNKIFALCPFTCCTITFNCIDSTKSYTIPYAVFYMKTGNGRISYSDEGICTNLNQNKFVYCMKNIISSSTDKIELKVL